jgi:hypothetical protein
VDNLASIFLPTTAFTWGENGVLTPLPRDEWLGAVRGRASAKSRGLERHDQIFQIDQASPTTAFVKLKCDSPSPFFTNCLCFLKVEGKCEVAREVFFHQSSQMIG